MARSTTKLGHEGTCPVCWHTQSVAGQLMVLHGYRRPGDGATYGNCAGYGRRAFELTAEDAIWYRLQVQGERERLAQLLQVLQMNQLEALQVPDHSKPRKLAGKTIGYEMRTVRRGDPDWTQVRDRTINRVLGEIAACDADLAERTRRIEAWQPAELRSYDIAQRQREERAQIAARKLAKKDAAAQARLERRIKEAFASIAQAVRWHAEEPEWTTRRRQTLRPGEIGTFVEVYGQTPAHFKKAEKERLKALA